MAFNVLTRLEELTESISQSLNADPDNPEMLPVDSLLSEIKTLLTNIQAILNPTSEMPEWYEITESATIGSANTTLIVVSNASTVGTVSVKGFGSSKTPLFLAPGEGISAYTNIAKNTLTGVQVAIANGGKARIQTLTAIN